ncbi:MAG: GSCFA domain-containing protein [Prevotella sp.]|nr:GSCFA domain-containing protein [Prevotella sp.]
MEFRTIVDIKKSAFEILPRERMLFAGSCFADNLGKRFKEEGFPVIVNPYGVMYNPASILHTVRTFIEEHSGGGHCFIPSTAFFTLGTNHVYVEKATEEIVDNCRKRPQKLFREELLNIDSCHDYLHKAVGLLREINPEINIVVTVSPIRYRKYGYHESQLSKATLLLAANRLVEDGEAYYFPAYEIVNDELRDYRFYQDDMLHPSPQAVEYIWERFVESCFSGKAKEYLNEWKPVREALGHRPFNPEAEEYKEFMNRTMRRAKALELKYGPSSVKEETTL